MNSNGILSAIGNAPLVRMGNSCPELPFNVYAKLEALNPGGSTKDRPAFNIIRQALAAGDITRDTVVIESSSGNMGIGLAQVCIFYGLRFVCVVDAKTTTQNLRLLEAYGAEVCVVTEPDEETGEYQPARIRRVRALRASTPNSFWADQYSNEGNAAAHQQTMREIVDALGGRVDYLFCATSTRGTLRGCSEYVRQRGLRTKVVGVDAVGSVIFGGTKAKRLLPGRGAAVRPRPFRDDLADRAASTSPISNAWSAATASRAAKRSSPAGLRAASSWPSSGCKDEIAPGANCVLIFPDRGERYLDTIYSAVWVRKHFGDITHLWEGHAEAAQPTASSA